MRKVTRLVDSLGRFFDLRELAVLVWRFREFAVLAGLTVLASLATVRDWWLGWPLILQMPSTLFLVFLGMSVMVRIVSSVHQGIRSRFQRPRLNLLLGVFYLAEFDFKVDHYGIKDRLRVLVLTSISITNQEHHHVTLWFTLRVPMNETAALYKRRYVDFDMQRWPDMKRFDGTLTEPVEIPPEQSIGKKEATMEFFVDGVQWLQSRNGEGFDFSKSELLIHDSYSNRTRKFPLGEYYMSPMTPDDSTED